MFLAIYETFSLILFKKIDLNVFSFKYLSLALMQFALFSTLKSSSIHKQDSSRTNFQYHAKIFETNELFLFLVITTNTFFFIARYKKKIT